MEKRSRQAAPLLQPHLFIRHQGWHEPHGWNRRANEQVSHLACKCRSVSLLPRSAARSHMARCLFCRAKKSHSTSLLVAGLSRMTPLLGCRAESATAPPPLWGRSTAGARRATAGGRGSAFLCLTKFFVLVASPPPASLREATSPTRGEGGCGAFNAYFVTHTACASYAIALPLVGAAQRGKGGERAPSPALPRWRTALKMARRRHCPNPYQHCACLFGGSALCFNSHAGGTGLAAPSSICGSRVHARRHPRDGARARGRLSDARPDCPRR